MDSRALIPVSALSRAKDIFVYLSPIRQRQLGRVMENALHREIALERAFGDDSAEALEIKARIRAQWDEEAQQWWTRFTRPGRMASLEGSRETPRPHLAPQFCG